MSRRRPAGGGVDHDDLITAGRHLVDTLATRCGSATGAERSSAPRPQGAEDSTGELRQALVTVRPSPPFAPFSAKRLIDPLLGLWSLAAAVDRTVARPIETLLVATVERSVITAAELSACIDRVETALARLA